MNKLKECLGDLYLTFASGWILTNLVLILLWGEVRIHESSPFILWAEILGTLGLVALGIERLIKDILRFRRDV